jgi:GT2 family glycosyltransferase
MENNKSITVIVVNRNNRDCLRECLYSLRRQTYRNFHVIVVDNASIDGSVEMLDHEFAGFSYLIRNNRNYGSYRAVNQAILVSKSEYVALMSSDAEAQSHWLEELVKAAAQSDDIGMCASKVLRDDQSNVIDEMGNWISLDGQSWGLGAGQLDRGQFDHEEETLFPSCCAAFYRRAVFETAGLFDVDFFDFGGDADLGLRARLAGWRAACCPRAVVDRRHVHATGALSVERAFFTERNRVWLAVKLLPFSLLLLNPFYAGLRFFLGIVATFFRKGPLTDFVRQYSRTRLIVTIIRADLTALIRIPRMLKKRIEVGRRRKVSSEEFRGLLLKFRVGLRELTFGLRTPGRHESVKNSRTGSIRSDESMGEGVDRGA